MSQERRIYPLDPTRMTPEEMAVTFAMTSRSPEPFDEIAERVTADKSAEFHERWVLGYGHSSVAEHAVLHIAVENISRLACDTLEDNRLASYTEKSSRYQVMTEAGFHTPRELEKKPTLEAIFQETCRQLFRSYERLMNRVREHLQDTVPVEDEETPGAHRMRIRRMATDACRAVLPAATLTNVGVTANARTLAHAISKLLSSELEEERELGEELRNTSMGITPTLVKYAEPNDYLKRTRRAQDRMEAAGAGDESADPGATLLEWDGDAERKLATALLYRNSRESHATLEKRVAEMTPETRADIIEQCLEHLGNHDAPVRELEHIQYLFEFVLDYGAYREFKRHRIQTATGQNPNPEAGYSVPPLVRQAGEEQQFRNAVLLAEQGYHSMSQAGLPQLGPYLLTHAHHRRVLTSLNLRQLYHLLQLRTSPQAHESIREPMQEALRQLQKVHPTLFRHVRLRE